MAVTRRGSLPYATKHRVPPTIILTPPNLQNFSCEKWWEVITSPVDPILTLGIWRSTLQLVPPTLIGNRLGRCNVYESPGLTLRLRLGHVLLITLLIPNRQKCSS